MKKNIIIGNSVMITCMIVLTSCGAFLDGMANMYGTSRGYNPYANFWDNAPVPSTLDPSAASSAAANAAMKNMTNGFWDQAAKDEANKQKMFKAAAEEMWNNPQALQNVQSQNGNTGVTSGGSTSRSVSSGACRLCGGSGIKVRETWVSNKTATKWCSECGKNVGLGHSHTQCDLCRGTGRKQ